MEFLLGQRFKAHLFIFSLVLGIFCKTGRCTLYGSKLSGGAAAEVEANFAMDPELTKRLSNVEDNLYELVAVNIEASTTTSSKCLKILSSFILEYEKDLVATENSSPMEKGQVVAENPLLTFRLIHRIFMLFTDAGKYCKENAKLLEIFQSVFKVVGLPLIKEKNLDEALKGILRLHYVYGLNATSDLRNGVLNGVKTGVKLNVQDCVVLAKAALKFYKAQILAYQWLTAANEILIEEKIEPNEILEETWNELLRVAKLSSKLETDKKFQGRIQMSVGDIDGLDDFQYYSTCRAEYRLPLEDQAYLYCYYDYNFKHYFYINSAKVEILSFNPAVAQIHDFVGPETIKVLIEKAEGSIARSVTYFEGEAPAESSQRTSVGATISNEDENPVLKKLDKKIKFYSGPDKAKKWASDLQLIVYGSVGHFAFHVDTLADEPKKLCRAGNRIATFLMFLSDVEQGGFTAFPIVGTFARPVKGSGIFWYNSRQNCQPDNRLLHGGCPVILGSKRIANMVLVANGFLMPDTCRANRVS